jgi:hypothetical protein
MPARWSMLRIQHNPDNTATFSVAAKQSITSNPQLHSLSKPSLTAENKKRPSSISRSMKLNELTGMLLTAACRDLD